MTAGYTAVRNGGAGLIDLSERGRIRVSKVDVNDRPDLAERFRVDQVPALALVVGRRVVSRLDGRATAPRIESMLEPHLGEEQIAV